MARYEDSRQDNANDARVAKQLGKTKAQFEGSALDQKLDAEGQAGMDRAAANAAGPDIRPQAQGVQPHHLAFKKPMM